MKPRLLDLFCGAGGAACGYQRAGFYVVGVDNRSQPNYCGDEFYELDALEVLRKLPHSYPDAYVAIHASPPCQAYSIANNTHGVTTHPDLVGPTRALLEATGLPYVIENVPGAPLLDPVTICGLALGLNVKRHRLFEASFPLMAPPCTRHDADYLSVFGGGARRRAKQIGRTAKDGPMLRRGTATIAEGRAAMGIDWMTRDELSQAIPPAMTELIGHQLMQTVRQAGLTPEDAHPQKDPVV